MRYERGAWLRVYGIPVHAWNDVFFRLCVSGIGRFLYVDECTTDKARVDFTCILIATLNIEIVNKTSKFVVDGAVYAIKIVEEWGCNLGEDAFMSEAETNTLQEAAPHFNNLTGLDEVQGEWELDDLVNDLHEEWLQHETKSVEQLKSIDPTTSGGKDIGKEFFQVNLSPVLQPISPPATLVHATVKGEQLKHVKMAQGNLKQGPWSIDWMDNQKTISDGGVVFSSSCKSDGGLDDNVKTTKCPSNTSLKTTPNKKRGVVLQSVGFMKKIAYIPTKDRKQIIRMLKK